MSWFSLPADVTPASHTAPDASLREAGGEGSPNHAARCFAVEAARLCGDLHCTEVLVLDTRQVSPLSDFIVIASGTSDRQIRSVGDDLVQLGRERGFARFGSEADARTTWLVLDFVDVIVHLFEPATRAHYDLEMMWGDVPRVEWRRPRAPEDR